MTRKRIIQIVALCLILGLVASMVQVVRSGLYERNEKQVTFSVSWGDVLALAADSDTETVARALKESGVTNIIQYPIRLQDLLDSGQVSLYTGSDLLKLKTYFGFYNTVLETLTESEDSVFLVTTDEEAKTLLQKRYPAWTVYTYETTLIFQVPAGETVQGNHALGYDAERTQWLSDLGFTFTYKFADLADLYSKGLLSADSMRVDTILVDAEPTEETKALLTGRTLWVTEDKMASIGLMLRGDAKQVQRTYLRSGHNLPSEYIIAVRDRGVDAVIFKPTTLYTDKSISFLNYNIDYVKSLTREVSDMGYALTGTREAALSEWIALRLFIGLGAGAYALWAIHAVSRDRLYLWLHKMLGHDITGYLSLCVLVLGALLAAFMPGVRLLSLGLACLAPVFALFVAENTLFKHWTHKMLAMLGVTFAGILMIRGLYTGSAYSLGMIAFKGVNAVYMGAFGLFLIYEGYKFIAKNGFSWTKPSVSLGAVVFVLAVAAAGYLLMNRSGNNGVIRISEAELWLRDMLEKLFYVRPRLKEYLIGVPCMVLAVRNLRLKNWVKLCLNFGTVIGLSSMLNTFLHFHSPIFIVTVRTLLGIVLGLVIGLVAAAVLKRFGRKLHLMAEEDLLA